MEELLTKALLFLALAAGGEGVIEFLVSPLVDLALSPEKNRERTVVFNYASAILGVCLTLGFNIGLVELFGGTSTLTWLDPVFSGILIGRGFNWLHGYFKKFMVSIRERLEVLEGRSASIRLAR